MSRRSLRNKGTPALNKPQVLHKSTDPAKMGLSSMQTPAASLSWAGQASEHSKKLREDAKALEWAANINETEEITSKFQQEHAPGSSEAPLNAASEEEAALKLASQEIAPTVDSTPQLPANQERASPDPPTASPYTISAYSAWHASIQYKAFKIRDVLGDARQSGELVITDPAHEMLDAVTDWKLVAVNASGSLSEAAFCVKALRSVITKYLQQQVVISGPAAEAFYKEHRDAGGLINFPTLWVKNWTSLGDKFAAMRPVASLTGGGGGVAGPRRQILASSGVVAPRRLSTFVPCKPKPQICNIIVSRVIAHNVTDLLNPIEAVDPGFIASAIIPGSVRPVGNNINASVFSINDFAIASSFMEKAGKIKTAASFYWDTTRVAGTSSHLQRFFEIKVESSMKGDDGKLVPFGIEKPEDLAAEFMEKIAENPSLNFPAQLGSFSASDVKAYSTYNKPGSAPKPFLIVTFSEAESVVSIFTCPEIRTATATIPFGDTTVFLTPLALDFAPFEGVKHPFILSPAIGLEPQSIAILYSPKDHLLTERIGDLEQLSLVLRDLIRAMAGTYLDLPKDVEEAFKGFEKPSLIFAMGNASKMFPVIYLTVPELLAGALVSNGLIYQSDNVTKTLSVQYVADLYGQYIKDQSSKKRGFAAAAQG